MEISQLRYFKAVAETQNMSKAAKKLFVSQPALSRSIKSLEEEIEVPLFDRYGKNLILNGSGRILLKYADEILSSVNSLKAELSDYKTDEEQFVSLSINVSTSLLATLLPDFKKQHPNIRFHIAQNDISMPDSDDYDICINSSIDKIQNDSTETVLCEEIGLIFPIDHPLAYANTINLSDVANEDFIQLKGEELLTLTKNICSLAGFTPNIVLYSDLPATTIDLVSLGMGISFVPEITWMQNILTNKNIVFRKISNIELKRYISISWRQVGYLSNGAKIFRNYLLSYFSKYYIES